MITISFWHIPLFAAYVVLSTYLWIIIWDASDKLEGKRFTVQRLFFCMTVGWIFLPVILVALSVFWAVFAIADTWKKDSPE